VSEHHGADGRLSGYTAKQIERIVGWKSAPGRFVAAMVEAGWLEPLRTEDGGRRTEDRRQKTEDRRHRQFKP
jgi:hypothetical protein